jgi:tetratricopeptide (TPR) repeat protein
MKFILLMTSLLIFSYALAMGQSEIKINKLDFKTDKPGFDAAWKHIKDGDSFYSRGGVWYTNAMNEYNSAYIYNNKNAALNYKLGVSCLKSDKRELASEYLLKAYTLKPDVADDILLLIGKALQYAGKYKEAAEKINEWLASETNKKPEDISLANRYLAECRSAEIIMGDSLAIEIRNMGASVNSAADEYSEVVSHDGEKMYFASRRAMQDGSKNYYSDTRFDENIYRSDFENGKWSVSLPAGKKLKTEFCETPLDIDATGTILYIYTGYEGNGDIQVSEFKKGEWRSPEPESFGINSEDPETSFSISPSGKEIAFISDRGKKGAGGKDIWFIYKNSRKWSKPVNAGVNINSSYNEESVRFSRGGDTLWFSSAGHNPVGGFDIFFSTRNKGGAWGPSKNAGYPVNTPWDEFFYFPSPVSDSLFFFVSNRSGGFGGLDIYSGTIHNAAPSKPVAVPGPDMVKTDSIPKAIIQIPDTIVVRDTTSVIKTINK